MTPSGHELAFRRLFAEEAETRLRRLGADLLRLEQVGGDDEVLASIFRDAHSVKGAASMVGLEAVARLAHVMEDVLDEVRAGTRAVSGTMVDALLGAADAVRAVLPTVLEGGEPDGTGLAAAEARLRAVRAVREADRDEGTADEAQAGRSPAPRPVEPTTVRVPVRRLDRLARLLAEATVAHRRVGEVLAERLGDDPADIEEYAELSLLLDLLHETAARVRAVPVASVVDTLQRAARDLARATGKEVRWEVSGEDTELDRDVLDQLVDPLLHVIRNAVDHGIEPPTERQAQGKPPAGVIRLDVLQLGSEAAVTISDDGRGIDVAGVQAAAGGGAGGGGGGGGGAGGGDGDALYLVFRSGLTTAGSVSGVSGRGVGLDAVQQAVAGLGGRVEVRSQPGAGTQFRFVVPVNLTVLPCLLLDVGRARYAVPMHTVVEARDDGGAVGVPVSDLGAVVGADGGPARGPVVVLAGSTRRHGFRVDALAGLRDLVLEGAAHPSATLDVAMCEVDGPAGETVVVLDPARLIQRARAARASSD